MSLPWLSKAGVNQSPSIRTFNLENCLNGSTTPVNTCMNKALTKKTITQCYTLAEKIKSLSAKEKIVDYCFYEISEFSNLNTCLYATSKFYIGENKDAALFECYRQFAPTINKKVCQKISQLMTYPEKRSYMQNQCENL